MTVRVAPNICTLTAKRTLQLDKIFFVLLSILIRSGFAQTIWTEQISGWEDNSSRRVFSVTWADSQLVAVGDGGVITSTDGKKWTSQSHNLGNDFLLRSIVWTGKQLFAVGEHGVILNSDDGIHWTKKSSGNFGLLNSIAWTGALLVAVGNEGGIFTSNTGDNWVEKTPIRDTNQRISLHSIAWTGSQLVVVGSQNSDCLILTSQDGNAWTERTAPAISGLNSITWTGNQLVAVGDRGVIVTSKNSATWQHILTDIDTGSIFEFTSVIWTGKLLLAAGTNRTIYSSLDGTNWSRQLSGNKDIYSITWTGSQFVAVGDHGLIITSPDDLAINILGLRSHENKIIFKNESNLLTFTLPSSFQKDNIRATIYSLSGKPNFKFDIFNSKSVFVLPSESLMPGRYILEVKNFNHTKSMAFYVVR